MARGPRISFPHAIFHVVNRFVDRHPFFKADEDYRKFLDIYFEEATSFGIWTYAYDLLPNHFHIVLETPSGEISMFLQRWLTRAAQGMNRRKNRVGHLFQGRSKTLLVEREPYFRTLMGYVLLNRVRAGLVKSVFNDPWNSVGEMLTLRGSRLARGPLWEYLFGHEFDDQAPARYIRECRAWLEELDPASNRVDFESGHRGQFLATPAYRGKILKQVERRRSLGDGVRRKTDRHRKKWAWAEIERASRSVIEQGGAWRGLWRTEEKAIRDIQWYVAHVGACWAWGQILDRESKKKCVFLPNTMVVSRIRSSSKKRQLADAALEMCTSPNV